MDISTRLFALSILPLLCSLPSTESNPNFTRMKDNLKRLQSWAQNLKQLGIYVKVDTLLLPEHDWVRHGEPLALTYANFYITNHSILVPQYGLSTDQEALESIKKVCRRQRSYWLKLSLDYPRWRQFSLYDSTGSKLEKTQDG